MENEQARSIIRLLNGAWPQKPLEEETATVWATRLGRLDFNDCRKAVVRLMDSAKFRPSLAEIVELANPEPKGETASEAFRSVLAAIIYHHTERADKISAKALQAVKSLGGWAAVGQWQAGSMSFHKRDFVAAYEDAQARIDDNKRLGITTPEQKAIAPEGGHPEQFKPVSADRVGDLTGELFKRIRGEA